MFGKMEGGRQGTQEVCFNGVELGFKPLVKRGILGVLPLTHLLLWYTRDYTHE